MARPVLCSSCQEVLEPTSKDYVVCGNCGEFNWVGPENRVPDMYERLLIAKKKIMKTKWLDQ